LFVGNLPFIVSVSAVYAILLLQNKQVGPDVKIWHACGAQNSTCTLISVLLLSTHLLLKFVVTFGYYSIFSLMFLLISTSKFQIVSRKSLKLG